MFIAHYENTMRNAKFAPQITPPPVRTVDQIRAEKRAKAEAAIALEAEKKLREARRREILARIETALRQYRDESVPLPEKLPIREILRTICDFHNVTVAELMARGRQRHMVKIRDEAIRAVADARPDMSLPEIARVFDNRDHTTIMFSLRKTAKPGFDYRGHALPASMRPS